MSEATDAEVVVIGLGVLGSAAAWQLARRGIRVVGLERFRFGHGRGSSHGESRNLGMTYHTPEYVALARSVLTDWAVLEGEARRTLVRRCGGVKIFPEKGAVDPAPYLHSLEAAGVPFELLDAAQARTRWPALAVPDGAQVLFHDRAGMVPGTLSTLTLQDRARAHGARLHENTEVTGIEELGDGGANRVRVHTADGRSLDARSVVVTVDGWTNRVLASLGVQLPLTVTKEQVAHFAVNGPHWSRSAPERHAPEAFPMWTWMDRASWYGYPTHGEASIKVGQEFGGAEVDPDSRDFAPDPAYVQRMREFVAELVPGAGELIRVNSCLYTVTPDHDFVLGPVPGHEAVVVGLGAAHAFKFAPWFGRVLADLALTGTTSADLTAFSPSRPALAAGAPPPDRSGRPA